MITGKLAVGDYLTLLFYRKKNHMKQECSGDRCRSPWNIIGFVSVDR